MTTMIQNTPGTATNLISAGLNAVRTYLRCKADHQKLLEYDDRMLSDVGLARSDIAPRFCWSSLPMTGVY